MPEPEERLPPDEERVAYPEREPPTDEEMEQLADDAMRALDRWLDASRRRRQHQERDTP